MPPQLEPIPLADNTLPPPCLSPVTLGQQSLIVRPVSLSPLEEGVLNALEDGGSSSALLVKCLWSGIGIIDDHLLARVTLHDGYGSAG
jgi:hypothetical protein